MADIEKREIKYEGVVRKCPNCGDPIEAFELICDKCGYNFSTNRMSTGQERLAVQLENIKSNSKRANCINAFPVPIDAEEIIAFMLYAAGNIDMKCVSTSSENNNYSKGEQQVAEAWIGKMEQMHNMALISLPGDPRLELVEKVYQDKKKELKRAHVKRVFSNPFISIFILFFGGIILMLILSLFMPK